MPVLESTVRLRYGFKREHGRGNRVRHHQSSKKEFWELATWFDDVQNRAWDEQMEADAESTPRANSNTGSGQSRFTLLGRNVMHEPKDQMFGLDNNQDNDR